MVKVTVSIERTDPTGAYPATDAPVDGLTNDELAVVLGQVVDELCRRAVWTGPRPRVGLVADGWIPAVGVSVPAIPSSRLGLRHLQGITPPRTVKQ